MGNACSDAVTFLPASLFCWTSEFRAPTQMIFELPKPKFSSPLTSACTQSHKNWFSSGGFGLMSLWSKKNTKKTGKVNLQICRWCRTADPYRRHDTGAQMMVDCHACGWVVTPKLLPLIAECRAFLSVRFLVLLYLGCLILCAITTLTFM